MFPSTGAKRKKKKILFGTSTDSMRDGQPGSAQEGMPNVSITPWWYAAVWVINPSSAVMPGRTKVPLK